MYIFEKFHKKIVESSLQSDFDLIPNKLKPRSYFYPKIVEFKNIKKLRFEISNFGVELQNKSAHIRLKRKRRRSRHRWWPGAQWVGTSMGRTWYWSGPKRKKAPQPRKTPFWVKHASKTMVAHSHRRRESWSSLSRAPALGQRRIQIR